MREADMPRRAGHTWSTRRTTGSRAPGGPEKSALTRAADELLAESAARHPRDPARPPSGAEILVPVQVDVPGPAAAAPPDLDQAIAALTPEAIARLNSLAGADDDEDDLAALLAADDDELSADLLRDDRSSAGGGSGGRVERREPEDLDPFEGFSDDEISGRNARSSPSVRRLGAGLVALPRVEPVDPITAVLDDPVVPEGKRFCWKCQEPVGRSGPDGPGAVAGECAACGSVFNFRPALTAGELVADQYLVKGCLAHGGLGWIYLAVDTNVSDRWVVLKGLQNPQDFEAHVVALAERQFLSEITHPGVVKIYNFVKHRSLREVADGYIVMEYVGGRSLKKMLDLAGPDRIPVADAIAYLMEVLPALDYLHSLGLAYNDLKPDNIMVTDDEVKLIDLGAVAAMESYGSIYGTPGYQAPEIIETGPTVATDIYAAGRTLASLILALRKNRNGDYRTEVPSPRDHPLLARYPGVHRLLIRATHPEPARRFPSTYAMYCQLAGVLRMVLAADTGREHPQASVEFGALRGDFGIDTVVEPTDALVDGRHRGAGLDPVAVAAALPVPLIDADDPSVELLSPVLHADARATLDSLRRTTERISAGTIDAPVTFETEAALAAVRAHLDLGDLLRANALLDELRPHAISDWRIVWFAGVTALLDGRYERAHRHFDDVHTMLPGEIAPVLALAATAELMVQTGAGPPAPAGDTAGADTAADEAGVGSRTAADFYRLVWQTNHGVVSAAFGLARCLAAAGDTPQAVRILDEVPETSRHYGTARMTGSLLLVSRPVADLAESELVEAAERLDLSDEPRVPQVQLMVLGAALEWLRRRMRPASAGAALLGYPLTVPGLRAGLESRLRAVANTAPDRLHRYRLIDLANAIRPHTRW